MDLASNNTPRRVCRSDDGFQREFFQTLNNRRASRITPTDPHVGSVHDGLSHQLQGEVDVAFSHRMYRITISLVKKRLPTPFPPSNKFSLARSQCSGLISGCLDLIGHSIPPDLSLVKGRFLLQSFIEKLQHRFRISETDHAVVTPGDAPGISKHVVLRNIDSHRVGTFQDDFVHHSLPDDLSLAREKPVD